MAKWRVAVQGSVGKSILIDDALPSQVAALARQVSTLAAGGGATQHRALQGLQVGDDHPQYAMWQAEETIIAPWNFQAEPFIEGKLLTEFIQDVVGLETVQNTDSITWTYNDTAGTLEADVVPEFIQDTVGAMLVDSSTIDLSYIDLAGTITADVINSSITYAKMQNVSATSRVLGRISSGAGVVEELTGANLIAILSAAGLAPANPAASIGLSAVNGSATTYMRSDAAPALSQSIAPTWTGNHTFTPASGNTVIHAGNLRLDLDNMELQLGASQDLLLFHDGTNSVVRNNTGQLRFNIGTSVIAALAARFFSVGNTALSSGYSGASTMIGVKGIGASEIGSVKVESAGTSNLTKFEMFAADSVAEAGIFVESLSRMVFYTNSVERFRIPPDYNAIRIAGTAGDPASPSDGDIWMNTVTGKFRGRVNGVSVDFN